MTDAPEKIWVWYEPEQDDAQWSEWPDDQAFEGYAFKGVYLRADHALALVADAYEAAAVIASDNVAATVKATAIRAMTPSDALAARDARDKRVRDKALREAVEAVRGNMELLAMKAYDVGYNSACTDAEDAILNLIEGDQTDE